MKRKVITTSDGSSTLYVEDLDEHYHSVHGAIGESEHIFIRAGFHADHLIGQEAIAVLEIGFGTGLNALLTYFAALEMHKRVHYTTIEPFPLTDTEVSLLNYTDFLPEQSKEIFGRLHRSAWEEDVSISDDFVLCKHRQSALATAFSSDSFHLVYFDAFAPLVQPELWTDELFTTISKWMRKGGVLVTYSSKGTVKRSLQQAGFSVEKLPGPTGKREIIRATLNN
jgi:tRNA U34 5-methylaminomethyl-2-thiouridine-forming methyltransferase MnmC